MSSKNTMVKFAMPVGEVPSGSCVVQAAVLGLRDRYDPEGPPIRVARIRIDAGQSGALSTRLGRSSVLRLIASLESAASLAWPADGTAPPSALPTSDDETPHRPSRRAQAPRGRAAEPIRAPGTPRGRVAP